MEVARAAMLPLALLVTLGATAPAAPVVVPETRAVVAEFDGIIHPIAAEFFDEVIARADTTGA